MTILLLLRLVETFVLFGVMLKLVDKLAPLYMAWAKRRFPRVPWDEPWEDD